MIVEFWMGDVIKLREARKQAKRLRDEKHAAANRLLHGRTKAGRKLDAARDTKARRDLDQHRVDTGDEG
jgi:F0F1-type ATP synthase membrane subunit b/b'